jgi:hypothetical protein
MIKRQYVPMFVSFEPNFDQFNNLQGFVAALGDNATIVEIKEPHKQAFVNRKGEQDEFDSFSIRVLNPKIDGTTESVFINSSEREMDAMMAQYNALKAALEKAPIKAAGKLVRATVSLAKDKRNEGAMITRTNYSFVGSRIKLSDEVLDAAVPCDAL